MFPMCQDWLYKFAGDGIQNAGGSVFLGENHISTQSTELQRSTGTVYFVCRDFTPLS